MAAKPIPSRAFVLQCAALIAIGLAAGVSPVALLVLLGCIVKES
jgi:hypothetical protein